MKHLLIAAILSLASIGASADQTPTRQIIKVDTACYPTAWLIDQATSRFGETQVYSMKSDKGSYAALFVNKKTGTYTYILDLNGEFSCVIDGGKGVKSYAPKGVI